MKLYYYSAEKNFGDTINPWFWNKFIDQDFCDSSSELFLGIGTLINNRIPEDYNKIHIMGSGAGYGDFVPSKSERCHVHCVRGPLTAKKLEIDESLAIADPAILLNEIIPIATKRNNIGFMPHLSIDSARLREVVEEIGIVYISPQDDPDDVISKVNHCERLICSAMHGAILAEALRVPWFPVSTSKDILNFKWQDWLLSMELEKELKPVVSVWSEIAPGVRGQLAALSRKLLFQRQLKNITRKGDFILAKDDIFNIRKERLKEVISNFNHLYSSK